MRKLFDIVDALRQNLPRLKFNKKGNLLAVSTADGGVKILANADGFKSMRAVDAIDPKVCICFNSAARLRC